MQIVKEADCGDTLRVVVYTKGSRWDSCAAKKAKREWRKKAWQAINFRNCRQKLEERIACNFTSEDYHIVYTLSDAYYTDDYKRMRSYYRTFLSRLRYKRKKRGAEMPIYIYVMEGLHGDKRLHIHQLISAKDMDWAELVECWPYGAVFHTRIKDFDHRNHLGQYLTKEPAKLGRKRNDQNLFVASHGCRKPTVSSWGMADGMAYSVPDGCEVVHFEQIKNEFGNYLYYVIRKREAPLPS